MFSYTNPNVPDGYRCSSCGGTGCKLWRLYNTFVDAQNLLCATCAGAAENEDVSTLDERGTHESKTLRRLNAYPATTDQIGSMVPAVPTEDEDSYWGYTSVPELAVRWWRALPSLPTR